VAVFLKLLLQVTLGLQRIEFILLVDSVDSVHSLLVLGAHLYLLVLCVHLALCLLGIELLQFFPQLVGLFLLVLAMPLLLVLVSLVDVVQMFVILVGNSLLLLHDFLLVFLHLVCSFLDLLLIEGTGQGITLLFLAEEL